MGRSRWAALAVGLLLAACGGGDDDSASDERERETTTTEDVDQAAVDEASDADDAGTEAESPGNDDYLADVRDFAELVEGERLVIDEILGSGEPGEAILEELLDLFQSQQGEFLELRPSGGGRAEELWTFTLEEYEILVNFVEAELDGLTEPFDAEALAEGVERRLGPFDAVFEAFVAEVEAVAGG